MTRGSEVLLAHLKVCMERLFWGLTRRNQAWERMGGRCYYAKMGPCWIHCSDVFWWCLYMYFYDDGYLIFARYFVFMSGPNILLDNLGTNFDVQGLKPELQREAGVVCWDMALSENLATSKCSQISIENPPSIYCKFPGSFPKGKSEGFHSCASLLEGRGNNPQRAWFIIIFILKIT